MPTAFITFGVNQLHDVASGGGVGVGAGTNAPNNTDVKSYVDAVAQGLKTKGIATAVVLTNVASLTGLAAVGDGVTLGTDGMIALLTTQTTGSQNGAWVVHAGAWTRPANFAAGSSAAGAFWIVEQGMLYHDTGWVCSTDPPSDVVDTNTLALSMFFSATALANADGTLIFLGTDVRRAPITGDVSVPGGSNVATLASTAVSAASYGDASHVATFTVDAKGRLTAAGSVAIAIGAAAVSGLAAIATSGSASDLVSGTVPAARMPALTGDVTTTAGSVATTLASSGVGASTYGDASHVSQVTFDAKGRATGASSVAIAIGAAAVSGLAAIATSGSASDLGTGTVPAARMPALTGDITSSAGSVTTTLVSTGVGAAVYGDASHVAQVTLDVKGRATAASSVLIQIDASRIVSGNLANARLPVASTAALLIGVSGGGYTSDPDLSWDTTSHHLDITGTLAVSGTSVFSSTMQVNAELQVGGNKISVGNTPGLTALEVTSGTTSILEGMNVFKEATFNAFGDPFAVNAIGNVNVNGALTVADTLVGTVFHAEVTGLGALVVSWFGATPVGQQTGGAATASGTYGATEQGMINRMYLGLQSYGLFT